MKVIVAIDSLKGSLSSLEAGKAVEEGIKRAMPEAEIIIKPVADGGEGTVSALTSGLNGRLEKAEVTGPLGQKVKAVYGILPDKTAVIEMAEAAGLPLVPDDQRNPMHTTTYGVGELIQQALEKGCRKFIVGIGGSATNDGGTGMLQALGCHFYKKDGTEICPGAEEIEEIARVDIDGMDRRLEECRFEIACDVTNPLCGERGASAVFAPQKGADARMVGRLDDALSHLADVTEEVLKTDNRNLPGAGAAGGLGFAFASYLDGDLRPGVEIVLDAVLPEKELSEADIVVTGEGRFDGQTAMGKAPVGIAKRAKEKDCMVLVFAGSIEPQGVRKVQDEMQLVDGAFPILPGVMTLEEAMQKTVAYENMSYTAEQVFRVIGNCQK
ncbi:MULTISPECIES: glycerate kinase family protein [unclassified Roseburia]|uniref:glycerate kinase family protein n=1 Tax=unclassified Roseburia TaxID=2637578 RepID=UPI000E49EAD3|nr:MULTISPECIES: glycerate kinase [unclassified Roseburia]RGI48399.1 glycerate kinase [Roseburia sp. OM03-7AC]RGI51703.1 glycerate kinase [Roseburia sp. OM03-18]